jgi:hypothetical protein
MKPYPTQNPRALLPCVVALLVLAGCADDASDGSGGSGTTSGTGGGGTGGATSTGSFTGGSGGGGGGCSLGESCDDGAGVCTQGGECCPSERACGAACCAGGLACSFGACVAPGADCTDSTECADGEFCEYALGEPLEPPDPTCVAGAPVATGKCLPRPPECPNGTLPDPANPTCFAACEVVPAFPEFTPTLRYAWGAQTVAPFSTDIMMTPIVISLDDDDCDGKITARDIPEIVFSTFTSGAYNGAGVLRAISIVEGQVVEKWTAAGVHPTKHLAGGNIDGLPGNEVVGCTLAGEVRAWNGDGTVLWTSAPTTCFMPQLADLDHDGDVEVVVEGGILDGATGNLQAAFAAPLASSFALSDADGDGDLDVVTGSQVFDAQGALLVDTGTANVSSFYATADWKSPWPALADFDLDGKPEIVVIDNLNHTLLVWRMNPLASNGWETVRAPVDINGPLPQSNCPAGAWGNTHGGGPPTIADFTGDGVPDVATAGGIGYAVFDGAALVDSAVTGPATLLWIQPTVDCSSASTGSTVFDFDGDGVAEVVYSDQQRLRIYDGPTGNVLVETCNTTATLIENPVVADVDNDGHADIVAVSNAYASGSPGIQCNDGVANGQSGVRIFSAADNSWVRTRRIWNQHTYHVTNVEEDGTIPQNEPTNWLTTGLNNFRQNKQPGSEFAAPDAVVTIAPRCVGPYALVATVRNLGTALLPAGVVVGFYQGAPGSGTLLGTLTTQSVLFPAESEQLVMPMNALGDVTVYAVVDDTDVPHPEWAECRIDNNTSQATSAQCAVPQ